MDGLPVWPEACDMQLLTLSTAGLRSFGILLWELVTGEVPLRGKLRPPMVPTECPQVSCSAQQDPCRLLTGA